MHVPEQGAFPIHVWYSVCNGVAPSATTYNGF